MVAAVQTLALPMAIIGVATTQLSTQLDQVAAHFASAHLQEQVAWLAMVFGITFAAVTASHTPSLIQPILRLRAGGASSSFLEVEGSEPRPMPYPIEEMKKVQTDKDKFMCLYPVLRDEMLESMRTKNEMPEDAVEWCREMMDYTVPGGKLNRGTMVVAVLRAIQQRPLSEEEVAKASVCGWAIEFLQAFFLVADDVMDDSQTRRGQPCWYKLDKVKLIAINDSFLLESFVFALLKLHFGNEPYYSDLLELMLDIVQKTEFGQLLDLTTASADKVELERFTLEKYSKIVKYKTAFYSFYLPVAMGMILAGVKSKTAYQTARNICIEMGEYFQIQDDYLDCFGDPEHIGKVGTDIQDNKCSWLVVQALDRCSPAQRALLEKNYGQWNDKKVEKVKELYRELDLPKLFEDYEEASYKSIQDQLEQLKDVPREVFDLFLKKIYKRSK